MSFCEVTSVQDPKQGLTASSEAKHFVLKDSCVAFGCKSFVRLSFLAIGTAGRIEIVWHKYGAQFESLGAEMWVGSVTPHPIETISPLRWGYSVVLLGFEKV